MIVWDIPLRLTDGFGDGHYERSLASWHDMNTSIAKSDKSSLLRQMNGIAGIDRFLQLPCRTWADQ